VKDRLEQLAAVPCPAAGEGGDQRCHDERMADALTAAVLGAQPEDPTTPAAPGIVLQVLVPLPTLLGLREDTAELIGYGDIPAAMARELAGDAAWQLWVHDEVTGHLLDQGKHTYPPNTPLGRYLTARDRHCMFPGCPHPPASATKTTPNRSIIKAHKTAPPRTPRRVTPTCIPAGRRPRRTWAACAGGPTGRRRSATTKSDKTPTAPDTGPPPSAAPTPRNPGTTDPTATAERLAATAIGTAEDRERTCHHLGARLTVHRQGRAEPASPFP
jgi:hypothetical protein